MIRSNQSSLVSIVNLLQDGLYHDGNQLGASLQMTRSAVWKNIKKLQQLGVKIDSIKGRGYALLEPFVLLQSAKISKKLDVDKIQLQLFESIDSTNEHLKSQRSQFAKKDTIAICLAEQQTQGKARLNRTWYSPFGQNVYLSCLYAFQKDVSELAGLSLVTSLAIIKTLHGYGLVDGLAVKWPNDIVYQLKQKLAGILIEIQAESNGISQAVIGIGLNANMSQDNRHISQHWTSMRQLLETYIDRNDLCARLINWLVTYLNRFNQQGFGPFIDEWMSLNCLADQMITIKNLNHVLEGKMVGINEQGHLLLRLTTGKVQAFSSGDTTVLKKPPH